jgi:hypothetical protein
MLKATAAKRRATQATTQRLNNQPPDIVSHSGAGVCIGQQQSCCAFFYCFQRPCAIQCVGVGKIRLHLTTSTVVVGDSMKLFWLHATPCSQLCRGEACGILFWLHAAPCSQLCRSEACGILFWLHATPCSQLCRGEACVMLFFSMRIACLQGGYGKVLIT